MNLDGFVSFPDQSLRREDEFIGSLCHGLLDYVGYFWREGMYLKEKTSFYWKEVSDYSQTLSTTMINFTLSSASSLFTHLVSEITYVFLLLQEAATNNQL